MNPPKNRDKNPGTRYELAIRPRWWWPPTPTAVLVGRDAGSNPHQTLTEEYEPQTVTVHTPEAIAPPACARNWSQLVLKHNPSLANISSFGERWNNRHRCRES